MNDTRPTYPDNGQRETDVLRMIAAKVANKSPYITDEQEKEPYCYHCERFKNEEHTESCAYRLAQPWGTGEKKK